MTLKILLTTSLAFSVLAFGSAELWAIAITQILVLWTACIWLIKSIMLVRHSRSPLPRSWTACIWLIKSITLVGHSRSPLPSSSFPQSVSGNPVPPNLSPSPLREVSFRSPSPFRGEGGGEGIKILCITILVFLILSASRLPYSLYPYGTKIQLIQILSLLVLFSLVTYAYSQKAVIPAGHPPFVIPERLNRESSSSESQFAGQRDLLQLVTTLVCIGFAVSLLAIIQKLSATKELLWFRELFSQRAISSFYGPFINRNTCAAYTGLIIPLAISAVMIQTDISRKMFYSFILATLLASQLFSLSRGGIASSLAAIILFTVFSFRISKSRLAKISSLVCAGGLAVALAAWIGYDPIFNRLKSIGDVKVEASYYMRFAAWEDTVKIVQDHPWFGTGLGTFPEIFTRYQTAHKEFTFQHAHNDFLELLSETGIVGFIIVFTGFAVWFRQSWVKLWQRHDKTAKYIGLGGFMSIFSLVLHSLVDFPLQNYAVLVLLMYIMAATTLATHRHHTLPVPHHPRGGGIFKPVAISLVILTILVFTPYLARFGIGSAYFALARTAARKDSNHSRAVLYLNRAIANDPDNAAYHCELAKRYLSLGLSGDIDKNAAFALAKRSLGTAATLSPHNATYNQR